MDSNQSIYNLFLRCDRPIEGCELTPVAYLQLKGNGTDANSRPRLLDSNSYYFAHQWRRGPRKPACANPACPRGNTYEPMHWCRAALGGPELACSVCSSAGSPSHDACFCSKQCFVEAWKDHSRRHNMAFRTCSISEASSTATSTPPNELAEEGDGEAGAVVPEQTFEGPPAAPATPTDPTSIWLEVHTEKTYLPSAEDVGCRLRLDVWAISTADNTVLAGPVMIYTEPVLSAPTKPPKRSLVPISGSGSGIAGAVRFRVVSYNVLAEIYATKQAYPTIDMWNLAWPYRRKILFDELEEIQGDVVCLQEVQADHFENDVKPFMAKLGYDGIYKPKSREFMGQYGKVDGCATFWKSNKFGMIENYCIEFNDVARQEASNMGFDESDARRYVTRLNRDNIALIVVLESLVRPSTGRSAGRTALCVVNTHLYSNYQRADVKLWQTVNLLREIQSFVVMRDLALMICGDFNSEPLSAVYEFITQGAIENEYPELNLNNKVRILPDLSSIVHELDLASAMRTGLGAEPSFTNYTSKFKGTLDYIFYTPSRLRVMAVTAIPEEEDIRMIAGDSLPSSCFPSDHILLCCDVALITTGAGNILTVDPNSLVPSNTLQDGSSNNGMMPMKGKWDNRRGVGGKS